MNIDRWLKRLWMVIGIVLLPLVMYGAASLIGDLLGRRFRGNDRIEVPDLGAVDSTTRPRAVRYDQPERVLGSVATLVMVRYGSAQAEEGAGLGGSRNLSLSSSYNGRFSPAINVIFFSPGDSEGTLLFDQPAFVSGVRFPSGPDDSLRTWLEYEVALQDTDGDRRLDEKDEVSLYVSDLAGRGLTRVLPEGQSYVSSSMGLKPGTILVYSLEIPAGANHSDRDRWRQRAFEYSLATKTATPYPALENPASRAGQILSK